MYTFLHWYLLFVNLTSAGFMAYDKLVAPRGGWRVPESSLLLLALLGGSPTIYFLISYLRHKSNKAAFRWRLNIILAVQILLLLMLAFLF